MFTHKLVTSSVRMLAHPESLYPIACNKLFLQNPQSGQFTNVDVSQEQWKRLIHTTKINRDMEASVRSIAGGIATVAIIGPGIGVGLVFGNLLSATARNPSLSNKLFGYGIMGAAFCESLGLFALVVAFLTII